MPGLGTIVNAAAIVAGGLFDLLCGKFMKPRIQESLTMACGVCVIFLGIAGAMEKMLSAAADGTLSSGGTMTLIASLVLGALIGEIINIEAAMERFGTRLRKVSRSEGDGGRRVDPGRDPRDHSTLFAKAVLDLIIVMVMTAASGKGCIFSAIPVAIFQGTITALSKLLEPVMTQPALDNLSLVGSVMIFCVGVNLVWGKKFRVANMLPGLVLAVVCAFLPWF